MSSRTVKALQAAFSPLQIRDLRIYLSGQAVSLIGTWLQITAQGWVVWELTRSATALGIVAMLGTFPILLLGPWAGVWADRVDRRRLLIFTQVGAMASAFALAILLQTRTIQLWHVYVISTVLGLFTAADIPAQQAFLGDLSGMREVRKAVNLNSMIIQLSRMIGPALAGFIIGVWGSAPAFWLNGLSFLAVIASLISVRASQVRSPKGSDSFSELKKGVRFLRGNPRIQDLMAFVVLLTFLVFPVINIFPAFVGEVLHGDAQTLGYLLAASGAGALLGTILVVPLAQTVRRPGVAVAGATIWMGVWLLVFSWTVSLTMSMVSIFLVSLAAPTVFTTALGLVQILASPEMRARLVSLFVTVSFGTQPFASLLIGYSADWFSTPMAILLNGLFLMGGGVLMLILRPELRSWQVSQEEAVSAISLNTDSTNRSQSAT